MPRSRLANRLAVQSPDALLDAIFEDLENGRLSAGAASDTRRIALLLDARLLLFREAERIQSLEHRAEGEPSSSPPALEDVDLAVLRLQAQILAAELRERLPKRQNEAAGNQLFCAKHARKSASHQA